MLTPTIDLRVAPSPGPAEAAASRPNRPAQRVEPGIISEVAARSFLAWCEQNLGKEVRVDLIRVPRYWYNNLASDLHVHVKLPGVEAVFRLERPDFNSALFIGRGWGFDLRQDLGRFEQHRRAGTLPRYLANGQTGALTLNGSVVLEAVRARYLRR